MHRPPTTRDSLPNILCRIQDVCHLGNGHLRREGHLLREKALVSAEDSPEVLPRQETLVSMGVGGAFAEDRGLFIPTDCGSGSGGRRAGLMRQKSPSPGVRSILHYRDLEPRLRGWASPTWAVCSPRAT